MKQAHTDVECFEGSSPKRRRLLREEELILDVTELLCSALEAKRMTKSELAEKLGKSKGFVTQVLSGNRNLTLRTIADIADALGYRIRAHKETVPDIRPAPARGTHTREARNAKVLRYG